MGGASPFPPDPYKVLVPCFVLVWLSCWHWLQRWRSLNNRRRPALSPAQHAQLTKQNIEMTQAALRVAQMVDGNQVASLWDGASKVAKTAVKRDAFVSQIGTERARLGAVVGRGQGSVTRVKYGPGAQVPEGLYVNVSFPTRFAKAQQPVRELVSFRLDEDKTWRLAGYSLRTAVK